jgi:NAD(P)H-hydrate epimerase
MPALPALYLTAGVRALEAAALKTDPGMPLMERAGLAAAEHARELLGANGRSVLVLAGPGNNGGDGLAAARHLGSGAAVHLLAEPDPSKAPDAALQLRILRAAGHRVVVGALPDAAPPAGAVWIDALFGTGFDRPLQGEALRWVGFFNAAAGPKLCIDIPSGLHGDTGAVLGGACRGDVTVTFAAVKVGMTRGEGPALCGRIVVEGLGLPRA